MLDICVSYRKKLDIVFNAKKTCLFKVGPVQQSEVKNLTLGDNEIEWVTNPRYLGVHFIALGLYYTARE